MNIKYERQPSIYVEEKALLKLVETGIFNEKKLMLVTGSGLNKRWDFYNDFIAALEKSVQLLEIVTVAGEPEAVGVDMAVSRARDLNINCVFSVGGGSVIDFGKAVSAIACETGSIVDYLEGVGNFEPSGSKLPFIAAPTTSGTGAEATKNAVIKGVVGSTPFKKSLRHNNYIPDQIVIDPTLLKTAPFGVSLNSGLDAITQLIGAFTSTAANSVTDMFCREGLRLAGESFTIILEEPENLEAREKMALAALYSGFGLANAGLGIVHGMAGHLGAVAPVPHGAVCGILLHPVLTKVIERLKESNDDFTLNKFKEAGDLLNGVTTESVDKGIWALLNYIKSLSAKIVKQKISDYIDSLIEPDLVIDGFANKNSTVKFSKSDFKEILISVL